MPWPAYGRRAAGRDLRDGPVNAYTWQRGRPAALIRPADRRGPGTLRRTAGSAAPDGRRGMPAAPRRAAGADRGGGNYRTAQMAGGPGRGRASHGRSTAATGPSDLSGRPGAVRLDSTRLTPIVSGFACKLTSTSVIAWSHGRRHMSTFEGHAQANSRVSRSAIYGCTRLRPRCIRYRTGCSVTNDDCPDDPLGSVAVSSGRLPSS
jgi:hypothetical protein